MLGQHFWPNFSGYGRIFCMLIELSVSNYRSFRDKQTLSMVAVPRLGKRENTFVPNVKGEKIPALLKVAVIYGPNASGRSSFISALGVVGKISRLDNSEVKLPVSPFRFDSNLLEKPSAFEFNFIAGGMRYTFNLEATENRIVYERLVEYPSGKERTIYERRFVSGRYEYNVDGLEGGDIVHKAWMNLTSPKQLFISQAVDNSSEELGQLKTPFEWMLTETPVVDQNTMIRWSRGSRAVIKAFPDHAENMSKFLRDIDIPISRVHVEESDAEDGDFSSKIDKYMASGESGLKTTLTHISSLGEAEFDFTEESGGTKNLIGFWLPWQMLKADGRTLSVDEFDSSLHPVIVHDLVRSHLNSGINSQLIFTTHNTNLMNAKILRRDQFWLTERDVNAATRLYSIYDFEGREGEDIERRYFAGRYKGLPLLKGR
ncbi:TPA: ATP/GTP-binding protein [Pseudomonas aeruginosa]